MVNKNNNICHLRSIHWLDNCKRLPINKLKALRLATQTTWGSHWSVSYAGAMPPHSSKYAVTDPQGNTCLDHSISISHSHLNSCIITALSQYAAVDIEPNTRTVKWQKFKRVLTDSEWQVLQQCRDPVTANDIFLTIWTLKEAIVKALHKGIAHQFPRIEISFAKVSEHQYQATEITTDITDMTLYWHSSIVHGHKLAIAIFD